MFDWRQRRLLRRVGISGAALRCGRCEAVLPRCDRMHIVDTSKWQLRHDACGEGADPVDDDPERDTPMKLISLRVDEDTWVAFKALAQGRGGSASSWLRRFMRDALHIDQARKEERGE